MTVWLLGCLMLAWHAGALANEFDVDACRALVRDPKIEVWTPSDVQPEIEHRPASVIGASVNGEPNQVYLGLTRASLRMNITINPRVHVLSGDWLCLSPDIEVRVYFDKLSVIKASETLANECVRQFVMEHEMRHVQFHFEALRQTAEALRKMLHKQFPPTFRFLAIPGDLAYRRQQFSLQIATQVQRLYKSFDIRHREIDNYVELQRSYQVCNGEILRYASDRTMYPAPRPRAAADQADPSNRVMPVTTNAIRLDRGGLDLN